MTFGENYFWRELLETAVSTILSVALLDAATSSKHLLDVDVDVDVSIDVGVDIGVDVDIHDHVHITGLENFLEVITTMYVV